MSVVESSERAYAFVEVHERLDLGTTLGLEQCGGCRLVDRGRRIECERADLGPFSGVNTCVFDRVSDDPGPL